ncbi:hypothetical protein DIPPA_25416 [Diplonema papillatum]|nr:hypothetical protein DIPPA_25416 [Diplonema papillatum]
MCKDLTSLTGYDTHELPKEFQNKLEFDVNKRMQFEGHPLARYANGGLDGFGRRLTRVYTALVALRLENGYDGAVMGLWNQDLVYILGELLCYSDDVMSLRVAVALEETFLSESVAEEHVRYLERIVADECPNLKRRLTNDESMSHAMFGLYRSFCGTLLAKPFGGQSFVPRLWVLCIRDLSLKPIMNFLTVMMRQCEHAIVESYDAGRGLTEVDSIIKTHAKRMHEVEMDDVLAECKNTSPRHNTHRLAMEPGVPWKQSTASLVSLMYPLAYCVLPSWLIAAGPPRHNRQIAIILTVALWVAGGIAFYLGLSAIPNTFGQSMQPTAVILGLVCSAATFLFPDYALVAVYGTDVDFQPLSATLPETIQ